MNHRHRWLGLVVLAGACSIEARSAELPAPLDSAAFEKLHRMLCPQPGESRWMEIDWYPTVQEARRKAAAEGKPIFLLAGSGGAPPAGC